MIRVVDVFEGVGPTHEPAVIRARAQVVAELRADPRRGVRAEPVTTGPAMSLGEWQAAQGTSAEWARWLWPDGLPGGVR